MRSRPMSSSPTETALLVKLADELRQVRGVLRVLEIHGARAAGRGNGAGRALPGRRRRPAPQPARGARCADARHRAAARLPGARACRRARHGAGAAAAAERPARRARRRVAVRRHAAAAEPEVRPAGRSRWRRRPASRRWQWRSGRAACARASRPGWSAGSATNATNRTSNRWPASRRASSRWPRSSACSSCGGWSAR